MLTTIQLLVVTIYFFAAEAIVQPSRDNASVKEQAMAVEALNQVSGRWFGAQHNGSQVVLSIPNKDSKTVVTQPWVVNSSSNNGLTNFKQFLRPKRSRFSSLTTDLNILTATKATATSNASAIPEPESKMSTWLVCLIIIIALLFSLVISMFIANWCKRRGYVDASEGHY